MWHKKQKIDRNYQDNRPGHPARHPRSLESCEARRGAQGATWKVFESNNIDANGEVPFRLEKLGRERARIGTQAIAMLGLPACVIDRVGRALAANNLFEKLAPRVATRSDDRLCLADNSANHSLRRSMERLNFRSAIAAVQFRFRRPELCRRSFCTSFRSRVPRVLFSPGHWP